MVKNPVIFIFNIRRSMLQHHGLQYHQHLRRYKLHLLPIPTFPNDYIHQRAKTIYSQTIALLQSINCNTKAHLVAYSLAGVDARMALDNGLKKHIHSLTTINSPHQGSRASLLWAQRTFKETTFDPLTRLMGIGLKPFEQFTPKNMQQFNQTINVEEVQQFSIGSERLPNNCTKPLIELGNYLRLKTKKNFVLENDGIFAHDEIAWGEHLLNFQADHAEIIGLAKPKNQEERRCMRLIKQNLLEVQSGRNQKEEVEQREGIKIVIK